MTQLNYHQNMDGKSSVDDDWEFASATGCVRNVVLVGRCGNGKSATGNSILGKKAFTSMSNSAGVTSTCQLMKTVLNDGQILNVIDTPGLFDFAQPEYIGKEILNCINMAKDGIHAVLVVLSARSRFSREEEASIRSLQKLFGSNISNYMVIVFTGGDDLEDNCETLDDYLGRNCPQPLKEILEMCGNRRVLFDNKTKNKFKKEKQRQQLLLLVNQVIKNNGEKPYTDEIFVELKKRDIRFSDQTAEEVNSSCDEQLMKRVTEIVESRLKEAMLKLEQQLAAEKVARLLAEEIAQEAQNESKKEINKLREHLERAEMENELYRRREGETVRCTIL